MKNLVLITTQFLLIAVSFGQKQSGHISFDLFASSDDPQVQAYVANMEGSMLDLYFQEDNIKSELYIVDFLTQTTIHHESNDTTLVLVDGMMGRIATKATKDDLSDEQKLAIAKMDVDLIEDEVKEILGYACQKAIITGEDEKESIVWYTTEIVPPYREGQYLFNDIPGAPLEIQTSRGKMNFKFVAFEYKNKLKKPQRIFSMEIPKGYVLKTTEEMEEMRKQGR